MGGIAVTPRAALLAVEEAAERPYGRAATHLQDHHGLSLCKHTLERLTPLVGACWLDRDDQELRRHRRTGRVPGTRVAAPDRCVIFADGVMVHTDGEWHEARVGTVRSDLPRPEGEGVDIVKSSVVRLADPAGFGDHPWRRARELGLAEAKLTAFIGDGAHWLWGLAHDRFPGAVQVLDFYHLCQHVHACADAVPGEASEAAQRWALELKGTLRAGLVDEALKRAEALPVLSDEHRQAKHELATYLSNNRTRMDYPRYERLGLPTPGGRLRRGRGPVQDAGAGPLQAGRHALAATASSPSPCPLRGAGRPLPHHLRPLAHPLDHLGRRPTQPRSMNSPRDLSRTHDPRSPNSNMVSSSTSQLLATHQLRQLRHF